MDIGESVSTIIAADERWNDTAIDLVSGEEFDFHANGEWIDWYVRTDAEGFESVGFHQKLFESLRRAPRERWFCLMGSIGKSRGGFFRIGTKMHYQAKATGRLFCFANDVYLAYWNNKLSVQLTVKRTR